MLLLFLRVTFLITVGWCVSLSERLWWWVELWLQMYRFSYTASYIVYNMDTRWGGCPVITEPLTDLQKQMVVVNLCVFQGSMGAEPCRGSQRGAPTCSLGTTRTPAGECVSDDSSRLVVSDWIYVASTASIFWLFVQNNSLTSSWFWPGSTSCTAARPLVA